ncbi:hypothetical protein EV424DRAFT_1344169 [Suillus variegatus]|nr:hypothetical protein EV424DRAFT_1344169 [Suillus variegatus]
MQAPKMDAWLLKKKKLCTRTGYITGELKGLSKNQAHSSKFAQKKTPDMIKDLATQLWRQADMRIFMLSTWKTKEVKYLHHVVIPAVDQNDDENGNKDREGKESQKQRRKKEEFTLETFLIKHYGFCSQKLKVSVPWSAVREA